MPSGAGIDVHGPDAINGIMYVPGKGRLMGTGTSVPADSGAGWSAGAIFIKTGGAAGASFYVNRGSVTSCSFRTLDTGGLDLSTLTATAAELTRYTDRSTRSIAAGATLGLTEATHDGRTILLDTAAGSVVTLPAPTVGMRVRFLVTVKPTSNFHQVKVAAATDFLAGSVNLLDADGTAQTAYQADGTADDNIQLNGTTKGGQVGDWIEVEGITATQWAITGQLMCQAGSNIADPFSAAV